MNSLVNYDYSDDENEDSSGEQPSVPVTSTSTKSNLVKQTKPQITSLNVSNETRNNNQQPSSSTLSKNDVIINSSEKSSGRVQIKAFDQQLIPEDPSDSDDEDKNERRRLRKSEKGSGLISMLPKPKNQKTAPKSTLTSLVPNSVFNRSKPTTSNQPKPVLDLSSDTSVPESNNVKNFFFMDSDDDDDNEEVGPPVKKPAINSDPNQWISDPIEFVDKTAPMYGPSRPVEEVQQTYLDPNDDITYKKYIASKFDDSLDNVRIVDVDLSKHLSENKEWLKNISIEKDVKDEELESKAPNSTARRKNQITFLAYQAKKRELELKNQWAQNRLSKSQTRAKYGF